MLEREHITDHVEARRLAADLGLLHFATADDLVEHELAVLRLVAPEGFAQRLAVGG